MTVTVVRGSAGKVGPGLPKSGAESAGNSAYNNQSVEPANQIAVAQTAVQSEAAITAIRGGRQIGSVERIREPKQASRLADELSERLSGKDQEDALDVHDGLDPIVAREHFVG
ncbi:MAG: hypothetical protein K1X79_14265 [Oligoflexia bacterium]|nr:hypothetical protein [Oligoflexia bacterium]